MVLPHQQARWPDQPANKANVDPGAARWVTFAKERKPRPSPETLIAPTTPRPPTTTPPSHPNPPLPKDPNRDRFDQSKTHNIRSTLVSRSLAVIPDPPQCFCRLPASHMDTAEFGIIYECYHFDPQEQLPQDKKRKHVCAFHVHKRPWDHFRKVLKDTGFVDCHSPELSVCPAFNFAFCVIFEVSNPYPKRPYSLSACFCNVSVTVQEVPTNGRKRIALTCHNFYIEGGRPKCSWFLWAEQVPFKKPSQTLHAPRARQSPVKEASAVIAIATPAATPTTPTTPSDHTNIHHNTLLSALIQSNEPLKTENCSLNYNSPIDPYHNHNSLMRCLPKPVPIAQDDPLPTNPVYENYDFQTYKTNISQGHIIPSTVYKNMVSGSYPVETIEWERRLALAKDKSLRESRILNERLKEREKFINNLQDEHDRVINELERLEIEYNNISLIKESTLESRAAWESKLAQLQEKHDLLEIETTGLRKSLTEEVELRQSSQRSLAALELNIIDLKLENKELVQNNKAHEESLENATPKDLKCRVCFQEPTEYALVPCYHYAYCLSCADKLTECAVCRTPKISIQKVYIP
ncbi:hypothetical protein CLU79DRAFT_766313 [Phycomyces nitens]|nr:hypothetical protein CLU79DRAFT_766313 [Phycomyces nitens]